MKDLEAVIWCPSCHTFYAQVFRVQKNETVWVHETDPADVPARCTRCETVLERQRR